MKIVPFADAGAFLSRAEPFLLADEARHNLTVAIGLTWSRSPAGVAPAAVPPFFATVEDRGQVLASAVRQPPFGLVVSPSAETEAAADWPWLAPLAAEVRRAVPDLPQVQAPPALARAFAAAWEGLGGPAGRPKLSLRLHRLDAVRPVPAVPGRLRRALPADRDLVLVWLLALHAEATPDDPPVDPARGIDPRLAEPGDPLRALYLWETPDLGPTSICGTAGPTPHGVRINAVYTPPEHRRRGYATAAVAELSRRLLAGGRRFCVLHTDLANPTSNHIYAEIGYRPVGDVDVIALSVLSAEC